MKKKLIFLTLIFLISGIWYAHVSTDTVPTEPHFTMYYQTETHQPEVVFLYAHGLGATQWQGKKLYAKLYGVDGNDNGLFNTCWLYDQPLALFDFPDALNDKMEYKRTLVNLGGYADIERLAFAHKKTRELLPNTTIIGSGLSRGAASWLTYAAYYDDVAALILEAPFDSYESIVKMLMKRFNLAWLPYGVALGMRMMQLNFPSIDITCPQPRDVVKNIPKALPILLVHSRGDAVVPVISSKLLYAHLMATGHTNTHLLLLDHGSHGKIMRGEDQKNYQAVVHAFLKQYNFPYCEDFAAAGQELFAETQPAKERLLHFN